jgi:hypothetical protein
MLFQALCTVLRDKFTYFSIDTDSGVGAGIDSYYEYCLKAYILLGEEDYLQRFNQVHVQFPAILLVCNRRHLG